jgi:hypothetical protein
LSLLFPQYVIYGYSFKDDDNIFNGDWIESETVSDMRVGKDIPITVYLQRQDGMPETINGLIQLTK